jgi:5-methylcytosine-specific restriction endonuclease McrA
LGNDYGSLTMGDKKTTLDELDLLQLGHTIQVGGVVYAGEDTLYVCTLPDEPLEDRKVVYLDLDQEDWKAVIRQTDLLETEILAKDDENKLVKTIVRKSTRQIEQGVSWAVFKRDHYHCRYCGADDRPLTVDHLVLWEDGGPSIESNLVACCRKCNKTRGRMPYPDWLHSKYYKKVSANLPNAIRWANQDLVDTLDSIPLRTHTRGR